jgi:hypothetical protein
MDIVPAHRRIYSITASRYGIGVWTISSGVGVRFSGKRWRERKRK